MPPKMDVKEKFYFEMEKELMPDPIDDVEAFLNCARYNDEDDGQLLREYLERHPEDVDARDSQGRTAVHMAAANGHMPILEMLFKFGPLPDVANHEGNTALHFAALNNRVEAARRLIAAGWTASAVNSFNRTPFQLIQGKRFEDMEALLLEHDDSLDAYQLPVGSSVEVPRDEDEAEEGHASGSGDAVTTAPPASQGEAGARAARRPAKAPSKQPPRPAPRPEPKAATPAARKPEGGVLGTTSLDGVE